MIMSVSLSLIVILYIFLFSPYFARGISFALKVRRENQNNIPRKVTQNDKKCVFESHLKSYT